LEIQQCCSSLQVTIFRVLGLASELCKFGE
jgi:hypothetical protein